VINRSSKTKFTNNDNQASTSQMRITPINKRVPLNRRIPNQTILHNPPPDAPTEAAAEKQMLSALLTSKTKQAQSRTRISPIAHPLLSYKCISEHQPKEECMFRNRSREPNKLMPANFKMFISQQLSSLCTRILARRRFPNW
jgi:hypothetical protein